MRYKVLTERHLESARQLVMSAITSLPNPNVSEEDNLVILNRALTHINEAIEKVDLENDGLPRNNRF